MNENGGTPDPLGPPSPVDINVEQWTHSRAWLTDEQWVMVVVAVAAVAAGALLAWAVLLPVLRMRRRARKAGVTMSFWRAFRLTFSSRVAEKVLIQAHRLRQAQVDDVGFEQLLAHGHRGGDVSSVVDALIQARRCGVRFDWDVLCRIDLTGRDPGPIVKGAAKPWTLKVPGELLFGEPIPAIAGDGVELRIRGEAEVISRPNEDNPVPREPAMIARVAQRIVSVVSRCRDHRELLRDPSRINQQVNAAELTAEPGLRLLRFSVTQIERGAVGVDRSGGTESARQRIDRMLERQPIEQMSADELAQLAPAYLQFGDAAKARWVCEQALQREPNHPRGSRWLLEALEAAGEPLEGRLKLVDRCIANDVDPIVGWRLIRASILCRMATERDADTGEVRIVDRQRYVAAADALRSLGGADVALARRGVSEGWIDSWDAAFPGISATASEVRSEPSLG